MSTIYLIHCIWQKGKRQIRSNFLILLGLICAAEGFLLVLSVARNRELNNPWYGQRSAEILFDTSVSAFPIYEIMEREVEIGRINGFAFIADTDVSGGVSLGGIEGNLWQPVSEVDEIYNTERDVFWIHNYAVPDTFRFHLTDLTATVNGIKLQCEGLSETGLNWNHWSNYSDKSVELKLADQNAAYSASMRDEMWEGENWAYFSPVLTSAKWMANHEISIIGLCIALTEPNDMASLNRICKQLPVPHSLWNEWDSNRIGKMTVNEWVYLGALILAMMNVAAMFFGLIDGYQQEFYMLRKTGLQRTPVYLAVSISILLLSVIAFIIGISIFHILLRSSNLFAKLTPYDITILLLLFISTSEFLAVAHTRGLLKEFTKKNGCL